MPLINKQPNAILTFCPIDIQLVQSWWQYGMSDLAIKSLTLYVLNICSLTYYHSAGSFFAYIANYTESLSFVAEWYDCGSFHQDNF